MRVVIQRTLNPASVTVRGNLVGNIHKGLIIYIGVEAEDNEDDISWLSKKISDLRIFNDQEDKMNLSIKDINGEILAISQFTLYASTKKGNRPSFIRSANAEIGKKYYEALVNELRTKYQFNVATGIFGEDMQVHAVNDGPVTIIIDTKNRE